MTQAQPALYYINTVKDINTAEATRDPCGSRKAPAVIYLLKY